MPWFNHTAASENKENCITKSPVHYFKNIILLVKIPNMESWSPGTKLHTKLHIIFCVFKWLHKQVLCLCTQMLFGHLNNCLRMELCICIGLDWTWVFECDHQAISFENVELDVCPLVAITLPFLFKVNSLQHENYNWSMSEKNIKYQWEQY